jgi:hypothetical protein
MWCMDTEPTTPTLASLRARHPAWQIALENGVFVAVNRPAQTSQHITVHQTLEDLAARLDELDER